jgi:hypothetical protein
MLSALGVVVLYLGSLIEVLDISMAVISSLFAVMAVIEYGGIAPWAIYAVTGILSAVLLPSKLPAVMYILFFGFYPIVKERIERIKNRWLGFAIKEIVFNVCLVSLMFIAKWFMLDPEGLFVFEVIFFCLANLTFVIYDIALTRIISLYIYRIRKKFRFK